MHKYKKNKRRIIVAFLFLSLVLGSSYFLFSSPSDNDHNLALNDSEYSLEIITELSTQLPSEDDNKRLLGNTIAVKDFSQKAEEVKEIISVKNAQKEEKASFFSSLSSSFSNVANLDYFDEKSDSKLIPVQAPDLEINNESSTSVEVAEIKQAKNPNVEVSLSGYELKDNELIIRKEVVKGDTIGSILDDFLTRKQLYQAIAKAKPIRNLETVRIGQSYEIVHDSENNLVRYEYEVSLDETFVLHANIIKPEIETELATKNVNIAQNTLEKSAQKILAENTLQPEAGDFALEIDETIAQADELIALAPHENTSEEKAEQEKAQLALAQTAQDLSSENEQNALSQEEKQIVREYTFNSELVPVLYDIKLVTIDGNIQESLSSALADANEGFSLSYSITRIFQDKIDFFSDLQKGDSFKLLVEKKYKDGKFVKYGKTLAAFFKNRNKQYTAYRFEDSKGHSAYFDKNGHSLQGLLLKSPLDYTRISSGYTMNRRHPILGVVRPHQGIDYAAPSGTPIVSIGDGVVTFVGWKGGYGKTIVVRHTNGLQSQYAHMRSYAKVSKKGAKVSKGQTIGYVGSTGLSTGPHLDFRVKQNGKFVNPASVVSESVPPLKGDEKNNFLIVMDKLNDYLNGTKALTSYNPDVNLQDNEG